VDPEQQKRLFGHTIWQYVWTNLSVGVENGKKQDGLLLDVTKHKDGMVGEGSVFAREVEHCSR